MLARVGETLFLVARELERIETLSRFLEATHAGELEHGGAADQNGGNWWTLVRITSDSAAFLDAYHVAESRSVSWHLSLSDENPDSIRNTLARARGRANSVRDRLSSEVWESLNGLHREMNQWSGARLQQEGIYPFCRMVRQRVYLILGLIDSTLRRDDHWTFLRLGRFLERAQQSARLVAVHATSVLPDDPVVDAPRDLQRLVGLLHAASAREQYAGMHAVMTPQAVTRFLVFDSRFPRSVAFCLRVVEECQLSLIEDLAMVPRSRPLALTREAREFLTSVDSSGLAQDPQAYLDEIKMRCVEIADAVHSTCFAPQYIRPGRSWDVQAQNQSQN